MLERLLPTVARGCGTIIFVSGVVGGTGCLVETEHCDDCGSSGGTPYFQADPGDDGTVISAAIDTDQTLEVDPGQGIGVFVEYLSGGHWHVFTACDTAISNVSCPFNVVATVSSGLGLQNAQLDGQGAVLRKYSNGLELVAATRHDLDGMQFDTAPGTTVRFDVYLDGARDGRFTYWVGNGAVHRGAPTDPIDLKPSSP